MPASASERDDREWPFLINGVTRRVTVGGRRAANDGGLVGQWCRNGHGLALKSVWDVAGDLRTGALVEVLGAFAAGTRNPSAG